MGQPTGEIELTEKLSEMTTNDISKKIRDMYQLRRACHEQVNNYKQIFKNAGDIIDLCEKELRRRGHV